MTAEQQVELFNLLIRDEGRRLGIPPARIVTTSAIDLADEAIDAITEANPSEGDHIATGDVLWQFKKPTPNWTRLTRDLQASETAQAYFARGAGYTYVEGRRLAPSKKLRRIGKLQNVLGSVGCTGPVSFLTADDVARWATRVPAAVLVVQSQIREYFRADRLLSAAPHVGIEYQRDELRDATIEEIRRLMFSEGVTALTARVIGPAGVGKTRLVLELLHEEGISELALYALNPPSHELFSWIEANEETEAVVVIDECDELEAEQFETLAGLCAGRLKVITIGLGRLSLRGPRTFSLNPLEDDAMERVVRSITTSLLPEQVRWIVEQTRGYVKLGRAVTLGVARGAVDFQALHTDDDIRRAIERLVLPEGEDIPRRALSGLSLLTRVGWRDEVVDEAKTLATFMGLSWEEMRFGAARAIEEGLVSTKGRYWYVSPEFLAATLAARVWATQPDRVEDLHAALPERAKDALLQRLAGLDVPGVRDVLNRMLGGEGPFRDIDSLSDPGSASLFSVLARGAPEAAVRRLDAILGPVDRSRLMRFSVGRRELLGALEFLASQASSFRAAAYHMLSLAEAENEPFGNNASGVWHGLFRTFLGATEASGDERLDLLRELLGPDSSGERRRLVIQALGAALEPREIGFPIESGATPPRRWRPETWSEARRYKKGAVELLLGALNDDEQGVRHEAASEAVSHARALANVGLVDESIRLLDRVLEVGDYDSRKVWEAARAIKNQEEKSLSLKQAHELEELALRVYGNSLPDRVRRYTAKWSWVDWPASGFTKERPEEIASQLANEVFADPGVLHPLLPWLSSKDAEGVWPFGHTLGELDSERQRFEQIAQAARTGDSAMLLCAYLSGRSKVGDSEWVDELVDGWSTDPESGEWAVEATIRLGGSDHAARRLFMMIDGGLASPTVLNWTQYGRWLENVSPEVQIEIVERLIEAGPEGSEAALGIVHDLLTKNTPLPLEVTDMAWRLLARDEDGVQGPMGSFHWEEIARFLVDGSPERVAELVLHAYTEGAGKFYDRRLELLSTALERKPTETWGVIGNAILVSEKAYRLLWELERIGTVDSIPIQVIEAWLDKTGERGATVLAQAVKPKPNINDSLLDLLLSRLADAGPTLEMNYWTGGFTGPESLRIEDLIREADGWRASSSDAVRRWSEEVVANLRKRLEVVRVTEDDWE